MSLEGGRICASAQFDRVSKARKQRSKRRAQPLFTIGYQERKPKEFLEALRDAGISTVVDLRAVPLSRRVEFRKNALSATMENAGIGYVGFPLLGSPPAMRKRLKDDGDYDRFFSEFRRLMVRKRSSLQRLIRLVQSEPVALLCYERHHDVCHRSVVASYVKSKLNCDVVHL